MGPGGVLTKRGRVCPRASGGLLLCDCVRACPLGPHGVGLGRLIPGTRSALGLVCAGGRGEGSGVQRSGQMSPPQAVIAPRHFLWLAIQHPTPHPAALSLDSTPQGLRTGQAAAPTPTPTARPTSGCPACLLASPCGPWPPHNPRSLASTLALGCFSPVGHALFLLPCFAKSSPKIKSKTISVTPNSKTSFKIVSGLTFSFPALGQKGPWWSLSP